MFSRFSHRKFKPGDKVWYMELTSKSAEYAPFSPTLILRQAFAVWPFFFPQPREFIKPINDWVDKDDLKRFRVDFVDHVQNGSLIKCDIVRVKARVIGYLTDEFGVMQIEHAGPFYGKRVVFHKNQVFLFRKKITGQSLIFCLPPGLRLCIDARKIELAGDQNGHRIEFQAIGVFAGNVF